MIFSKFEKNLIFVIGSGRSGTHLLGRTLGNNEYIDTFIEDKEFFVPITRLAVGLDKNQSNFRTILKKYKGVFGKSKKKYILEKTHPNIWFVEEILEYFPKAKFIGIQRNLFGTVSSMLRHKGVLGWYKKLPLDQINPFLGINEINVNFFKDLPIEMQCAYRWLSHVERLEYLKVKFPDNVKVITYEDFYDNYENLMNELKLFLDIGFDINSEKLKESGKEKWKENLTETQIRNIENFLSSHG